MDVSRAVAGSRVAREPGTFSARRTCFAQYSASAD